MRSRFLALRDILAWRLYVEIFAYNFLDGSKIAQRMSILLSHKSDEKLLMLKLIAK